MKVSVVEWFSRTLKNDMWKQFMRNENYKWIDLLPRLVRKQRTKIELSVCDFHNRQQTFKHDVH